MAEIATKPAEISESTKVQAQTGVKVIEATGILRGPFSIYGSGFGDEANVLIAGRSTRVNHVRDDRVKGIVPDGLEAGMVDATINGTPFKMRLG